jgi:hypothetical protein
MAVIEKYELDSLARAPSKQSQSDWGWLPQLTLANAVGLLILSLADIGGRASAQWADLLFWIGLLVAFAPVAVRILSGKASRRESIALLLVLTVMLYLQRILQYPLGFAYNDEFQSMRTAQDIASSEHLFHPNPLLPVGPAYPGLQIVTNALSELSHLPFFLVAGITICLIRLMFTLALFLVYEKVGGSTYLAAIATLLYSGEPNYPITGGQFAYSSVGIPLAMFALYAILNSVIPSADLRGRRKSLILMAVFGLGALTVTHHVTSYFLLAFLLLWLILALLPNRLMLLSGRDPRGDARIDRVALGMFALIGLAMAALWLVFVGGDAVVSYLLPPAIETVQQLIQALTGSGYLRPLFQSVNPLQVVPPWERLIGLASAGLILIGQAIGFYQIWRQRRTDAFTLAMVVGSLLYPISLVVRFTSVGASIASRATEYSFFPLAFILAIGAMAAIDWLRWFASSRASLSRQIRGIPVIMASFASIIFLSAVVVAAGQTWWHTPGPYIPSAGPRSVSPENIDAATWARTNLGTSQRFTGDLNSLLFMASYGRQWITPNPTGPVDPGINAILFSPRLGPSEAVAIRRLRIRYLVIDQRFSSGLPAAGFYFDGDEPNAYRYTKPLNPQLLTKYDGVKGINRLFDNGDIVIYDLGAFDGNP